MEGRRAESNDDGNKITVKKVAAACDVEALKRCLQENKGDHTKCQEQLQAFKSSCSVSKPNASSIGSSSSS